MSHKKEKSRTEKEISTKYVKLILLLIPLVFLILYPILFSPYTYKQSIDMPYTFKYIPNSNYLLLTYEFGRDLWYNISIGTFNTMIVSLFSVMVFTVAGVLFGLILGFSSKNDWRRKIFESLFFNPLRNIQIWVVLFIVALFVNKLTQSSFTHSIIMFVLFGLLNSPQLALVLSEKIIRLKDDEFVDAAKASNISLFRLIFIHILYYESFGLIFLQIISHFTTAIMFEMTLTFFGIGFQGDSTSLGLVLKYIFAGSNRMFTIFPLIFALILIILLNTIHEIWKGKMYEG